MLSKSSVRKWVAGVALGSLGAFALAADDCGAAPEAPPLPDGANATLEELVEASNAVRAYIAEADQYLDCKETFAQKRAFQRLPEEEQAALRTEVSTLTAKRNEVGDLFNAEVEAYREANPE